jgi:hypothetical protein
MTAATEQWTYWFTFVDGISSETEADARIIRCSPGMSTVTIAEQATLAAIETDPGFSVELHEEVTIAVRSPLGEVQYFDVDIERSIDVTATPAKAP